MAMPHRVVLVAFPPFQLLDVSGPLDVFHGANQMAQAAGLPRPYDIVLAAPAAGPVAASSGIALLATHAVDDPALAPDTVLLAGGPGARAIRDDTALVANVHALCGQAARVGSICTGTFALAATGALDGRRATTHWAHFDEFTEAFPTTAIDRDALFVVDGKFHSSAGITAGIDSALAMVEHDLGRAVALQVAQALVVFLKRPGGQSQFSPHLAAEADAADPDRFGELRRWIAAHLADDLTVDLLAGRVAMSPRNFARRFFEAMNVTPLRYVQQLRIDAARRMLSGSDASVARVAERCGFASAEAMRLAFQRELKVSPSDFRARFQSTGQGLAEKQG